MPSLGFLLFEISCYVQGTPRTGARPRPGGQPNGRFPPLREALREAPFLASKARGGGAGGREKGPAGPGEPHPHKQPLQGPLFPCFLPCHTKPAQRTVGA